MKEHYTASISKLHARNRNRVRSIFSGVLLSLPIVVSICKKVKSHCWWHLWWLSCTGRSVKMSIMLELWLGEAVEWFTYNSRMFFNYIITVCNQVWIPITNFNSRKSEKDFRNVLSRDNIQCWVWTSTSIKLCLIRLFSFPNYKMFL